MSTIRVNFRISFVLMTCLLSPGIVWAEQSEAVISTGQESGSYYSIGERLRTAMRLQHGIEVRVETSFGSIQNLARLADPSSEISIALTQADALSRFLNDNPDFSNQFIVLGDMGRECALLITGRASGVARFADLKKLPGAEIAVNDLGSGAAVTFGFMMAMNPELVDVTLVYVDTMEALLQMKVAGVHTDLKAAMLVQRPSTRSAAVQVLLENSADYRLIPIRASDVTNLTLPDGSVVYTFEKVNIGNSRGAATLEVETLCTRGLLLASKRKLSREIRSKFAKSMLESSKTVIGSDE